MSETTGAGNGSLPVSWLPHSRAPTVEGEVVTVVGLVTLDIEAGYPGADVATLINDQLKSIVGINRKAWGEIAYMYGRMRCPPVDVLLISASVHVNKPRKEKP